MKSLETINAELDATIQGVPGTLHGGAIRVKANGIVDMNQLFFKVQEAFEGLAKQLQEVNALPPSGEGDMMLSFLSYGFPRMIPGLHSLDVVFVYIERLGNSFAVRLHFDFEAGARISYVTTFIT